VLCYDEGGFISEVEIESGDSCAGEDVDMRDVGGDLEFFKGYYTYIIGFADVKKFYEACWDRGGGRVGKQDSDNRDVVFIGDNGFKRVICILERVDKEYGYGSERGN